MTQDEKKFLLLMTRLTEKIMIGNDSIDEDISALNTYYAGDNMYCQKIFETFRTFSEKDFIKTNKNMIKKLFTETKALTDQRRNQLIGMVELNSLDYSDKESLESFVNQAISMDNPEFEYLNGVVRVAISLKDRTKIKHVLDKISTIQIQ
ncbi:hypothetical protein [Dehalobacter sp. TBBPA1]|uniref:hypothetical protein n=1 Tax=Dehalobacter sp. TBBPA1 TaxID=3235037 RepID=UPI0034A550B7